MKSTVQKYNRDLLYYGILIKLKHFKCKWFVNTSGHSLIKNVVKTYINLRKGSRISMKLVFILTPKESTGIH